MRGILSGSIVAVLALGFSPSARAGAKTPEDVFKAAAAAVKKEDVKTFYSHLTKDSQTAVAGAMLMVTGLAKAFAKFDKTEGADKVKLIDEVFSKHGLTEDALAKLKDGKGDGKSMTKALLAMGAAVKDKAGFVEDVLKIMPKLSKKDQPFKDIGEATLKDVKIDGDSAKGELTTKKDGAEKTETMYFRMEDGSWRIDVLRMMEEKAKEKEKK